MTTENRKESRSGKRIRLITLTCCLVTAAVTLIVLIRSARPSPGRPYEQLSVEEARSYMSYESGYRIIDAREPAQYQAGHLDGAMNIPESVIASEGDHYLKDRSQTIYIYGEDRTESCSAAQKLSDMGYRSVSEIGSYSVWIEEETESESEGLMEAVVK